MNSWFAQRGAHIDTTFLLRYGEDEFLVSVRGGTVNSVQRGPLVMPRWTFMMAADRSVWDAYWSGENQPGYHDLMALLKFRRLRLEGDLTVFMQNLFYFKSLVRDLGGPVHGQA